MTVDFEACREIVAEVFVRAGVRPERARQQADLFTVTEGKGVLSHGVNLTLKYTEQFLKGVINTEPNVTVLRETESAAVLDGDQGLGVAVIGKAIDLAMEKAARFGVAAVTVTNLQHYAAGLYYGDRPAENGMILTMMANSPSSMAPFGGSRKLYGTNPLTFAAPMGSLPAYCLDMASSVCAGNKLENAMSLGQSVPEGLGLDRNGKPSTDPGEILKHGSLLPFGGAKGSGVAGMINILAGVLSGAAYRDDVISLCRDKTKPANYGCFIQIIDVAKFMDYAQYVKRAETWGNDILESPPAAGFDRVIYPGYAEGRRLQKARSKGLTLSQISEENLIAAGKLVGLDTGALLKQAEI